MSQAPSSTLQPFPASSAQGHQARHLLALPGTSRSTRSRPLPCPGSPGRGGTWRRRARIP
ncbi:hypothetical protein NKG05_09530 [Oerskovia sp. M15]